MLTLIGHVRDEAYGYYFRRLAHCFEQLQHNGLLLELYKYILGTESGRLS